VTKQKTIIGTRGSELALWQPNETAHLLDTDTEIKVIKTSGDMFYNIALQGQLEQGFFTKEIERQLIAGDIDVAVHSLKDLPTQPVEGLTIGAVLPRASVNDLLIVNPDWHDECSLLPVKKGCGVGAMSLRRQALLRTYGPQAKAEMIRGNVPSRIERCVNGTFGAIIIAAAGVNRLGLKAEGCIVYELSTQFWIPAPGQGAIAVQARANDARVLEQLAKIDDKLTRKAVDLERRVLANFEGGCHTAFGAYAFHMHGKEWIISVGMDVDGKWGVTHDCWDYDELLELGQSRDVCLGSALATDREDLCERIQL
jgi:hydroxymethylbilane synthase